MLVGTAVVYMLIADRDLSLDALCQSMVGHTASVHFRFKMDQFILNASKLNTYNCFSLTQVETSIYYCRIFR